MGCADILRIAPGGASARTRVTAWWPAATPLPQISPERYRPRRRRTPPTAGEPRRRTGCARQGPADDRTAHRARTPAAWSPPRRLEPGTRPHLGSRPDDAEPPASLHG